MTITKRNDGVLYTHPDKGERSSDVTAVAASGAGGLNNTVVAHGYHL